MSESERPDRLSGREITVEDIRALAGPSTPHFALQIRNRIQRLIAPLPADHPARVEGERQVARLTELAQPLRRPARRRMTAEAPAAGALERAIELLDDAPRPSSPPSRGLNQAGYLDLLEGELESTGPTQDLMVTRLVPAIYERYWRPALGRVAKGVTGPGMAEEMRIARLLLGLGEGDTVLDLACGPGNFSREFARAVGAGRPRRSGIDASRDDARARRRGAAPRRPRQPRPDPRRRDRAAVSRRELRRRLLLRRPASVPGPVRGARRDAPGAQARRADRAA